MLAKAVCESFLAVGDWDASEVVASSTHSVEPMNFDEDFTEQWQSFVWRITVPPQIYGRLAAEGQRSLFRSKILGLSLGDVLGPLDNIVFDLEEFSDPDWRARARLALSERENKTTNDDLILSEA